MKNILIAITLTFGVMSCGNKEVEETVETIIPKEKPDVKFGLDSEIRFDIYHAIHVSEREADEIAMKLYPTDINSPDYKAENLDKYLEELNKLEDAAKAQLIVDFNITEDVMWEIITEGIERSWNTVSSIILENAK